MLLSNWLDRWRNRGRNLFRYHDGRRTRYADPLALAMALESAGGEDWTALPAQLARLRTPRPDAGPTVEALRAKERQATQAKLLALTRAVFDLPALQPDGTGLSDAEAFGVLTAYMALMGRLAEAARPLPSSPGPSAPSPATPTTPPSADCSSTAA